LRLYYYKTFTAVAHLIVRGKNPDRADLQSVPIKSNSLFTNVLRLFFYKILTVASTLKGYEKSQPLGGNLSFLYHKKLHSN